MPSLIARVRTVLRHGLWGISAASVALLVSSYSKLCFVYLWVFSTGNWTKGVVVSAVARAREGGTYYQGSGGLLAPSWPYFPLPLFLTHALAAMKAPLLSLPTMLGGGTAFCLPLASAALSRSLGARWLPALAVNFCLYALLVPKYHTFELITAGFFPDACVALLVILVCLTLGVLERSERPAWPGMLLFGVCLLAAGLSKQAGVAGVAGSFVYLALFSRAKWAARRSLLAVVVGAGLAIVAVVLRLPHCYEVTVATMARHPKDWSRLKVVWDNLLEPQLPVVLLYVVSLPAALTGDREVRRRFLHLHCMIVPLFVVQILATVKEGGGGQSHSYNMEMVTSLLLPVAAWMGASRLSQASAGRRAALAALIAGLGAKSARDLRANIFNQRDASVKSQVDGLAEVRKLGDGGLVFAPEWQFWVLHKAGFRIGTGCAAIWHYAVADPQMKDPRWIAGIERAIRERRYALVSSQWAALLPDAVGKRLTPQIQANYAPAPGSTWMVPRP